MAHDPNHSRGVQINMDNPPPSTAPTLVDVPEGSLNESNAKLNSTPLSRVWVFTWAFLTWLFTFAFVVLLIVAFTTNVSDGARTYTRSDTFTRTLGCIYKTPWSDWSVVRDKYTTLIPTTPDITQAGSDAILDSVMKAMRCHGNLPTQGTGPLTGGISGAVAGTDSVSTESFEFSSKACHCVHHLHTEVYYPSYANATTRDQVVTLGDNFFSSGLGTPAKSIVNQCVFTSRVGHEVVVDDTCFLSVSPYMVVLYANTVAGIFAALYLLHPINRDESYVYRFVSSKISAGFFVALNVALGITGLFFSSASTTTFVVVLLVEGLALLGVVAMIMTLVNQEGLVGKTIGSMINLQDNFVVVQRISFWFQYIITLPGIVLLYDTTQQHRDYDYLLGRALASMGIGFLAAGSDILALFNSKVVQRLGSADRKDIALETEDNLRSATWWGWYSWVAAVSMLVFTSPPISLSWTIVSLVPGAHTLIPIGFVFYVMVMPLVCMPNLARDNSKAMSWVDNEDSTALGLRLVVDLVARASITMAVYFWLALEP